MPVSKSGSVYKRREWLRVAEFVKRRDGYRCRKCGAAGKQIGGRVTLSVQHKRAARVSPQTALDPAFLETLCLPCHGRADGGRRYTRRD